MVKYMSKKVTIAEINKRIQRHHGNIVTMKESTYTNISTDAIFIDKDYGEWWANPNKVSRGRGHPERKRQNNIIKIDEIKRRVKERHGTIVQIIESTYRSASEYAKFVDSEFGIWNAKPTMVMRGHGHPDRAFNALIINIDVVKKTIKERHGDIVKLIDKTYKGVDTKAVFIDCVYGKWKAYPSKIMKGVRHPDRAIVESRTEITEIEKRIFETHGNKVKLDRNTYVMASEEAKFIDTEYGEYWSPPKYVVKGRCHPKRAQQNRENTNKEKYGVKNPAQNPKIALKAAKSLQNRYIRFHWKTGEELVCQGGWEANVVDYLNNNRTNYEWQPKIFTMPNGKTYRPDFYLNDSEVWVEIKGLMRTNSKEKWDWFKSEHPTAELWNENVLLQKGIKIRGCRTSDVKNF